MKYRRSNWWTKCKAQISSFFVSERKEEDVEETGRKRNKSLRVKQVLGKSGRWLFLLLVFGQNWLCIGAAAERMEPEGEAEVPKIIIVSDAVRGTKVDLDGKGLQVKQMAKASEKVETKKGVDKEKMLKCKCTLLNGSVHEKAQKESAISSSE